MRSLCLLVVGLLAGACAPPSGLADLQRLQKALQNRFAVDPPGVELRNDSVLVIAFEDSVFGTMDSVRRAQHAETVAAFVRDTFPVFPRLSAITIGYVRVARTGRVTNRTIYDVKGYGIPGLMSVQPRFQ